MSSEVWYRKWRPQTFAEVVGQKHVTLTLARAVANDRVAHAYLFCGPRGTGKTSTARILAKAVNCEANVEGQPCTKCLSCRAVTEGRALDLIEMDAASNRGIDEIRSLRDKVGYSPNSSRYKVYLIDEVHELTQFAFDALLKTLEEPPEHVIFVLATTEAHRLPETILSRCQRFDFQRIKLVEVVSRLRYIAAQEGVKASDSVLEAISRRATGSLRDAESVLEQIVAAQGRELNEENVNSGPGLSYDQRAPLLIELLLKRRLADLLNLVAAVRDDGADLRQFTAAAVQHLRSVLLVRAGAAASLAISDEACEALRRVAESIPVPEVLRAARALSSVDFRADPQSPLPLELALIEFIEVPAVATLPAEVPVPAIQKPRGAHVELASTAVAATPASTADRVRSALAPRAAPPSILRSRPAALVPSDRRASNPVPGGAAAQTNPPPADGTPALRAKPAVRDGAQADSAAMGPESSGAFVNGSPHASPFEDHSRPPGTVGGVEIGLPPVPDGEQPLAEARRQFRRLYERCGELGKSAARLLNSGGCDIVEIDDRGIVIGFKHPRMVELAGNVVNDTAIRRSVAEVYGDGLKVLYRHQPDIANRLQLLAAERPSHLLDEALRLGAKPAVQA